MPSKATSAERGWAANDHLDGDLGRPAVKRRLRAEDAVLALMRATVAHVVLVERRLMDSAVNSRDLLAWHRTLDAVQRTAMDTAAKVISLRLEEREARIAEQHGAWLAAATNRGLAALTEVLGRALPEAGLTAFADAFAAEIRGAEKPARCQPNGARHVEANGR